MNVTATGTWRPRAKARSPSDARRRSTPLPASTIGRSDAAMSRAAWSIASSVGSGRYASVGCERLRGVARLGRHRGEVLGQLDVGRAWLLELGDPERLADDLGDRVDPGDPRVPLRDRVEHPDDVDELMGLLVELVRAGLAGQRDHRRPVEKGVGDPGDEVRRARAQGRHGDRGVAGQPAVDVGHEGRALLVPGRHVADPLRPAECVEQVERLLAGDREHIVAALGLEALDEQLGGGPSGPRWAGHGRECSPDVGQPRIGRDLLRPVRDNGAATQRQRPGQPPVGASPSDGPDRPDS